MNLRDKGKKDREFGLFIPSWKSMEIALNQVIDSITVKAQQHDLPAPALQAFVQAVTKVAQGSDGLISEASIEPVNELPTAASLGELEDIEGLARELAVVKLNGGLGTGMGLAGPKSLLKAKGDETFLDIIAKQILGVRKRLGGQLPGFYLMNSFGTQEPSLNFLKRYPGLADREGRLDFVQSKVPKLDANTLLPAISEKDSNLEWCPPGHGDIYPALLSSGILDSLLDQGVKYLFVSNADNLGATVDFSILAHFAQSGAGFMMEVARRTLADRKGGHLARRRSDGKLILRESAQCASDETESFQDVGKYRFFNTNNLWIQLEHLRREFDAREGVLELPIIRNRKTLDPRDETSLPVLQLESAMGAAIECFDQSSAIEVPRSRFSPVKATSDLLALWSDAYVLSDDSQLMLSPSRQGQPPVVSLDSKFFKMIADFEDRFRFGVPSLIACEKLEVAGDVDFSAGVVCEGKVRIENRKDQRQTVPAGVYADSVVSL